MRNSDLDISTARYGWFKQPLMLALIAVALFCLPDFGSRDSIAYWGGVQALLVGQNPYDQSLVLLQQQTVFPDMEETQYFLNPPWSIPLLLPLFSLSFEVSRFILLALGCAIVLFTFQKLRCYWGELPLCSQLIFFAYVPFVSCLYSGQLSLFILLGCLLVLDWLRSKTRPWWQVTFAIYLLSIKPQAVYLVIIALAFEVLKTQRRSLLKIGATAITIGIFVLVISPYSLSWIKTFGYASQWRTATLITYLRDLGDMMQINNRLLLWIVPLLFSVATAFVSVKQILTEERFASLLLLSALTAPYAWVYDFSSLAILFYIFLVIVNSNAIPYRRRLSASFLIVLLIMPMYATISNSFEIYIIHSLTMGLLFILLRKDIKIVLETNQASRYTPPASPQ